MAVLTTNATATAKTYLLLLATVLYRHPWPDEHRTRITVALAGTVGYGFARGE